MRKGEGWEGGQGAVHGGWRTQQGAPSAALSICAMGPVCLVAVWEYMLTLLDGKVCAVLSEGWNGASGRCWCSASGSVGRCVKG
jgi:hypothetical protein